MATLVMCKKHMYKIHTYAKYGARVKRYSQKNVGLKDAALA